MPTGHFEIRDLLLLCGSGEKQSIYHVTVIPLVSPLPHLCKVLEFTNYFHLLSDITLHVDFGMVWDKKLFSHLHQFLVRGDIILENEGLMVP